MLQEIGLLCRNLVFICLFASILLLFFNRKRLPDTFRYLGYYLCWNLAIEITARILSDYETNNLPLLHLYTIGEFLLFALLYRKVHLFKKWPDKKFWIFVCIVLLFVILNSIFIQNIYTFNSYAKTVVQLILMGFAFGYFYQLHEKEQDTEALNWVNAAVLIYYSGSLFIFMFGNYFLDKVPETHLIFWIINVFLNLIFQVLILTAIWKGSRKRKFFS